MKQVKLSGVCVICGKYSKTHGRYVCENCKEAAKQSYDTKWRKIDMKPICGRCCYFKRTIPFKGLGECRRYPPTQEATYCSAEHGWCGEFKLKTLSDFDWDAWDNRPRPKLKNNGIKEKEVER